MNRIKNFTAITFLLCVFALSAAGQVVINEFSCSNINTIADNYAEYEDWIELYNAGATPVDLTGYYLSDKITNPTKWTFPSVSIPANGYLVIFASSRDEFSAGNLHTNFGLTQTQQEYIVLSNAAGIMLDSYWIEKSTQPGHSRGRQTDGAMFWGVFLSPTPGAANTGAQNEYAVRPAFNQVPGYYASPISVALSTSEPSASVYYTIDGSDPTQSSTLYTGAINIAATTVVKARTFSSNPIVPASFIETNTYFIGADSHTLPVISVSGTDVDNLLNGSYIEPDGVFEYFSASQVLIDEGTGKFNKHGNDSWAYGQRGFDYISKDQYGINNAIHDQIFRDKTRSSFKRLILKPAANDNISFEDGAHIRDAYVHSLSQVGHLKLDERSHESCILYVNGQYWGVYEIREKVDDHDFTEYYYNQNKFNLQFLKTWGGTWSEYGGGQAQTDWNTLKNFILSNNMATPANFDYVDSLYNWKSLVDYVVLNSYTVCSDWLNWNTAWWRGMDPNGDKKKWRYALWDMDATFGHYINYTGVPDTSPGADPCNPESLNDPGGQGHIPILNKLMENDIFRQYYVSRYIDLSNTVFSCEFMQHHLDSLIAFIQPEMQRQVNRWGGTYAGWENNVQELKDYIDAKCVNLSSGMIDCYNVTGPYDIVLLVDPPGSGNIDVNSINVASFPWTGSYFGNIDVLLDANEHPGWIFDYWELNNHTVSPSSTLEDVILNLTTGDTIIAHFVVGIDVELGNDTVLCEGASLFLNAGNTGMIHTWSTGATDTAITVTSSGTYSVTVSDGVSSVEDNIIVDFVDIPTVNLGNDTTLCEGSTLVLDAGAGADQYLWSTTAAIQTITVSTAGTYSVTIQNICGSASDAVQVSYSAFPIVDLGIDILMCEGDTFMLDAGNPGAEYLWQNGSSGQLHAALSAGVYSVTVTNAFGCTAADAMVVTTISSLDVDAGPDRIICPGESTLLNGTGGSFYTWSPAESLESPDQASTVATPEVTTTYTVIAGTPAGCSYEDHVTITVIEPVDITLSIGNSELCPGDEAVISFEMNQGTAPPYSYFNENGNMLTPPFIAEFYETDYFVVTAVDACGSRDKDSILVSVNENPLFDIYSDIDATCEPAKVQFNVTNHDGSWHYLWVFDDGSVSVDQAPMHTFQSAGVYGASLTVTSEEGCDTTVFSDDMVTVYRMPDALFYPVPNQVTYVDPVVTFENYSTNASLWFWDFGDGDHSQLEEPNHAYADTGIYQVILEVVSDDGCRDTAYGRITVEEDYTFYAPNAFTPESSSNNYFRVFSNGIVHGSFHMIIIDRWGEKVFETYNSEHGWDGTVKGRKLTEPAVFVWTVTYRERSGRGVSKHGTVTVIR